MNQILKGKTEDFLLSRIDEISELEAGSDEESAAIKNFVAVYELKNKEDEIEIGADIQHDQLEADSQYKRNQLKHDLFVAGITVAGTVITALIGDMIYVKLTHEGWKNESQGYYPSSSTFKNLFCKLPNLIKK